MKVALGVLAIIGAGTCLWAAVRGARWWDGLQEGHSEHVSRGWLDRVFPR